MYETKMRYSHLVYIHVRSRQWACQINPTANRRIFVSYFLSSYDVSQWNTMHLSSPLTLRLSFSSLQHFFLFTSCHLFCRKHCSHLQAIRKLLAFVKRFALILGVVSELILLLFIGMLEFCHFFPLSGKPNAFIWAWRILRDTRRFVDSIAKSRYFFHNILHFLSRITFYWDGILFILSLQSKALWIGCQKNKKNYYIIADYCYCFFIVRNKYFKWSSYSHVLR